MWCAVAESGPRSVSDPAARRSCALDRHRVERSVVHCVASAVPKNKERKTGTRRARGRAERRESQWRNENLAPAPPGGGVRSRARGARGRPRSLPGFDYGLPRYFRALQSSLLHISFGFARKPRDARPQHSLPLVDVALHFACLVRTIPRTRRDDTAKTEHQGLVTSYRARLEERSGTSGRCPCRTALFRTTRRASRVCLAADWRVLRFTRRRSLCHGHLRAPGVQRRREQPRVESSSHVEFVH